ncbi:MAG: site-specific integrase [Candidatus Shapirobacteria bacterium]
MTLIVTSAHIETYTQWLVSQNYQTNTVRNYLLDLKDFLKDSSNTLTTQTISDFIGRDSGQNNNARHLASISKFCQFALDQQLITDNIFSLAKKHSENPTKTRDMGLLLIQFAQSLAREHKSPITIKNYLGDIRQYIRFCESQTF